EDRHAHWRGGRQLAQEQGQIVAIGGNIKRVRRPTRAPARVSRERCIAGQRSAQTSEVEGLVHHHWVSCEAVAPMDPAPIVSTTSPSRASVRIAAGSSATSSTNTGSTF